MGPTSDANSTESPGTAVDDRPPAGRRIHDWFLIDGDRLLIAVGLSIVLFGLLLGLERLDLIAFSNDDSITRLAGGMIAGTFSLVTLVVSINQLILSREFTSAPETRERVQGVEEFLADVANAADVGTTPATPTAILELIVSLIQHRTDALRDAIDDDFGSASDDHETDDLGNPSDDHETDDFGKSIRLYTSAVDSRTALVHDRVGNASTDSIGAISAAIAYDVAWLLHVAKRLRNRHEDDLSAATVEAFDDLIEAFTVFTIAREHTKTTYLQRELTRFSQLTIYSGIPAVTAAILIGLLYADTTGPTLSLSILPYIVSPLIVVVVFPLTLLASYILRTATITRRTASIGPIVPQKDPEADNFDESNDVSAGPSTESNGGRSVSPRVDD